MPLPRRHLLPLAGLPLLRAPALAAPPVPEALDPATIARMREVAVRFVTSYGVPGLSVAIARKGRLVYSEGYGWADVARREALTPAHLFRIASLSKSVTSAAVFTLVEAGKLSLAHRVFGQEGILGHRFAAAPLRPYVGDITVGHLLTHTAGGWSKDAGDPMFASPGTGQAGVIAAALARADLAPPGTRYVYSNLGYCILGRVIEAVSGRPYADYVGEAVMRPSGVRGMRIAGSTLAARAPGEVVYYGVGENPYGMDMPRLDAAGGWIASAPDFARFLTRLFGDGEPALLRPETRAAMLRGSASNPQAGAGLFMVMGGVNHLGSLPGTTTMLTRMPDGTVLTAFCNTRRGDTNLDKAILGLPGRMADLIPRWPSNDIWGG